ncbi:hypothetical protein Val02_43040 [Virgisporangium aliadipatigenens]|uniref:Uncharacterized protein n=1 Tax=Virgisporangium aliadipatigenens TaxID=741659 RepID=A0A8J3YNM3_9ACTN|nr:hypothetical protein Val02_43040 [Virgisporangium aliadipatigenens]
MGSRVATLFPVDAQPASGAPLIPRQRTGSPDEARDPADATIVEPKVAEAPVPPAGTTGVERLWERVVALVTAHPRVVAAVAVLLGTAFSLTRTVGPGPLNSIFAEDASVFLEDALNHSTWEALSRPHNGYWNTVPRLLAEPASWVPLEYAPVVLSTSAALLSALMALGVYIASGAHLRHWIARCLAAVPIVMAPVGETMASTMANNVATLQFAAVYTVFWLLLWTPSSRAGRVVAIATVVASAASAVLTVTLIPLALLRLYGRRTAYSVTLALVLLAGTAANGIANLTGITNREGISHPTTDVWWALGLYVDGGLPHAMFGWREAMPTAQLRVLAWVLVIVVVLVAVLRLTRPAWLFAAVAGVHHVGVLVMSFMLQGGFEMRYVLIPELLLFAALAALLLPRRVEPTAPLGRKLLVQVPLGALAVVIAASCAANYRQDTGRSYSKPWRDAVAAARQVCADPAVERVSIGSMDGSARTTTDTSDSPLRGGWPVIVPCSRLR